MAQSNKRKQDLSQTSKEVSPVSTLAKDRTVVYASGHWSNRSNWISFAPKRYWYKPWTWVRKSKSASIPLADDVVIVKSLKKGKK